MIPTTDADDAGDKTYQPTKEDLLNLIPNPKDISIKSFLIDDGWQDTSFSSIPRHKAGNPVGRLSSMGPWHGLGDMRKVVSAIKAKGVENVGVWMTLQGYWFGIDPKSPLCEKYECVRHPIHERSDVNIEEVDEYQWIPHPERAGRFWLDWFEEMKSWGIDFVKVCLPFPRQARADKNRSTTRLLSSRLLPRLILKLKRPCG